MTTEVKETVKEKKKSSLNLSKKVSIRQYVDPEQFNMGLEKYNLSVFSGEFGSGGIYEFLGYREVGNQKTYLTGLDVNADRVRLLPADEKERKEKEIKSVLEYLKLFYPNDTLSPLNDDFWSSQSIEIKKPVQHLDLSNPTDLIIYYNILGGGYSEVASSFSVAKDANKIYKFYLHVDEDVSDIKTELTKLRNKARVYLVEMDDSDFEGMFKLAKILLPIEKGFNRKTPQSLIYSELDAYISGDYTLLKKEAPKIFLDTVRKDKNILHMEALVREALYQRFIVPNKDQLLWNYVTQVTYGRNENEVISFLTNPINNDELLLIIEKVNKIWK